MTPIEALSVLVVEDDDGIGKGLVHALQDAGHAPTWCRDAASTLAQLLTAFDLILLDLGLPDMDGLDLCRRLRKELELTPIMILTARGSETDVVVGLDAGADDYLVKPFRLAELLARLRALTRRRVLEHEAASVLTVGDITVDTVTRQVVVADVELELRPKEFDLLVLLMRNAGKAVTREYVMAQVWDEHYFGSTKTLDVHVAGLRHRFGEQGPDGSRISTLRGVGYRLELPATEGDTR